MQREILLQQKTDYNLDHNRNIFILIEYIRSLHFSNDIYIEKRKKKHSSQSVQTKVNFSSSRDIFF